MMKRTDQAVSPVIAVILMVAITVVLAAVVYTWISGFGGESPSPRTIGLASNGAISEGNASYTVTSASQDLKWSEVQVLVNGAEVAYSHSGGEFVRAGNVLTFPAASGQKLVLVDTLANAAMITLTLH